MGGLMSDQATPVQGEAGTFVGTTVDWLFLGPTFGLTRWDCAHGCRGLSEEKVQYWHVISFMHAGAFVLHSRGSSALIDSTAVLTYNPQEPYRSEHPFGCCDYGSAVVVAPETLLDVLSHYDPATMERGESMFLSGYAHGLSRAYVRQRLLLQSLRGSEPRDPLAVEAAILRIVGEVAEGCSRLHGRTLRNRVPERARREYVEDAKALLQQRYAENLRLDDLGKALHVSTYHLCRLFKEETGMPVHKYLNKLRLNHALEAIAAGEEDLSGLAQRLGYASHSHFTAAYHKEFGITPTGCRAS
jgi:AraC family transcriptional regulator